MLGFHGSIVIPENTDYAKEMRKHEAQFTRFGPPGRPYTYAEWPRRIYKAVRLETGGIGYEGFTVENELEQANMQSRGYSLSQPLALEALEREQAEHGKLAAERNWEAKAGRLSEKAVSEMRSAEAEHGARHLPMVPETPIKKKRGRPFKSTVPAVE
jgi:hypothetical protein